MSERQIQVSELEEIIRRLPGVLSAKVVVNDWGAIEEVHVLASSDKNPKQLVRDIESALAAKWGMKLDHRKISVAQLEPALAPQPVEAVELSELTVTNNLPTNQLQVTVLVSDFGRKFKGMAQGLALTRDATNRLVAIATVDAVNASLRDPCRFTLEDAFTVSSSHGREVAVSVVALVGGPGETTVLTGSCLVKGEEFQAAVRSVLDAVNRKIRCLPRRWDVSVEESAPAAEEEKAPD